jgi:hypothetical protein
MSLILDGTNGLSDVDGSAATPAIRGSDANTGVFFGADIIGFSEGGTECARFNADAQFVAAAGTALLPVITTTGDVNTGIFFPAADTIAFAEGGAEAMRIDSSGNLLVGATSGTQNTFRVTSAIEALQLRNDSTADSTTALVCIKAGATNSTSQRYISFAYNGGANGNGAIAGNGDSQATFITLSDERLKENIENLPSQLANVMALRPVEFDYKATGGHQIGFIAQEVQAVYPDLVAEGDDGYLTLAGFDKNTARLIKAIQEQQAIITALTARVEALEGAQA